MTYRVGKDGKEFDTLEEMLAEYRRNMTRWERIQRAVKSPFFRMVGPTSRLPRRARWAYQRVTRGWDDTTLWRLDGWLAKTLGAQLVTMSETVHTYPGDHYPYEQWTADMKKHGEALQRYAVFDFLESPDEWEATIYPAAREALRWVADNLGSLWD